MPAIRYPYNAVFPVATTAPGGSVWVRQKDGEHLAVSWMGFICRHGTGPIPGRYCKIRATDVTQGDGFLQCEWVTLKKNEFVLGWVVESYRWGQRRFEYGVYAVIDDACMPIVIDELKSRPDKQYKRAPVVKIETLKRTG